MSAREAFEKIQAFLVNVQKIICHDRIDYATVKCWFERNKFVNILEGKDLLDSQDFYKRIMREQASNDTKAIKFGMKAIIETLASDKVRKFYMENSHNALGDAETGRSLLPSLMLNVHLAITLETQFKWVLSNGV